MATNNAINTVIPSVDFFAYGATQNGVTGGSGTNYKVQFTTEIYDKQNNFNANTFTAPVNGVYELVCCLICSNANLAQVTNYKIWVLTTGANYYLSQYRMASGILAGGLGITDMVECICPMQAGETASVYVSGNGASGNAIGLYGVYPSPISIYFSGYKVAGI